jgi:hypothetical protein
MNKYPTVLGLDVAMSVVHIVTKFRNKMLPKKGTEIKEFKRFQFDM